MAALVLAEDSPGFPLNTARARIRSDKALTARPGWTIAGAKSCSLGSRTCTLSCKRQTGRTKQGFWCTGEAIRKLEQATTCLESLRIAPMGLLQMAQRLSTQRMAGAQVTLRCVRHRLVLEGNCRRPSPLAIHRNHSCNNPRV